MNRIVLFLILFNIANRSFSQNVKMDDKSKLELQSKYLDLNNKVDHLKYKLSQSKKDLMQSPQDVAQTIELSDSVVKTLNRTIYNLGTSDYSINLSKQLLDYYSVIPSKAMARLTSYEINNTAKQKETLSSLDKETKNLNFFIAQRSSSPESLVTITIKVYDSLSREVAGWRAMARHIFLTDNIDLGQTTDAQGRIMPGNIELSLKNGDKMLTKECFIDASDPSSWQIKIYLKDFNL